MGTRTYQARSCARCDREFAPKAPRQLYCGRSDCAPADSSHVTEAAADPEPEQLTALDVIDAFGLDYNLGSAARFLLEHDDGDELANLENSRTYLDRAIARLKAPV